MAADSTLADAVAALRRGGIVACPTEGVWGLGCDPFDEAAVRRLLALKQRDPGKGLILVAAHAAQLDALLDWDALPPPRRDEVLASWPGPHTWVMPATARVPRLVSGGRDSVAVRVSAHPVAAALCEAFGGPLVSTSANLSSHPPPRTRDELDPRILAAVDALVEGETSGLQQPTTIRDARTGAVIRGG
jgi:L-threonylcarbamoyladenylate synthase